MGKGPDGHPSGALSTIMATVSTACVTAVTAARTYSALVVRTRRRSARRELHERAAAGVLFHQGLQEKRLYVQERACPHHMPMSSVIVVRSRYM